MKISIVGTGYVGLVTGTCLAEMGYDVTCVDNDAKKVKAMRAGNIPIYEPGLETIFNRGIKEKRLTFTTSLAEGVSGSSAVFLALPTPPGEDGSADLSYILGVANDLGPLIDKGEYKVIIDKSTVPVGTSIKVHNAVAKNAAGKFDVVSNPEFLREGHAVDDFMRPDRVIIGTDSEKAKAVLREIYRPFLRSGNQLIEMDAESAELTKYAANAYLAARVSFMNAIAKICEETGADVDMVRLGIGSDERIGKKFLFPGLGFGGSCFPKDVKALIHIAKEHGYDFELLQAVSNVNSDQKKFFTNRILDYYDGDIKGKTIALWGLAFKPDTDDIREAASLVLIDILTKAGASIVAYDPAAGENVRKLYANSNTKIEIVDTSEEALKGADCLVIATEWPEFRGLNHEQVRKLLNEPVIFDGRNVYTPNEMENFGFHYESIGRRTVGE